MNPYVTMELPKARGSLTELSKITFSICIFAMGCTGGVWGFSLQNVCFACVHVAGAVEILAAAEGLGRVLNLFEERRHVVSRHRSSYGHLLASLFSFSRSAILLLAAMVCVHFLIIQFGCGVKFPFSFLQICACIMAWILLDLVNTNRNAVSDSVFLDNLKGLDYGSGMAQSFFYGYLRLCLPDTGNDDKGLVERIEDYISEQQLPPESFPVKRLFVLIPASSDIPPDLKDSSCGWMQQQGTLQKQIRNRAGVINRNYKNSVYRIKDPENRDDEDIYVVAEGATPCKTFNEVIRFSGTRKDLYEKHRQDILLRFYLTLVETVNEHPDCSELCEFIYYVDKDEEGKPVNVAHLIKQRIWEIKGKELSRREKHRQQWQSAGLPEVGRAGIGGES